VFLQHHQPVPAFFASCIPLNSARPFNNFSCNNNNTRCIFAAMKRAIALILSIVYLTFAFGGSGYEPAAPGSAFTFVSPASENDEAGKNIIEKTHAGTQVSKSSLLHKIHKHLATVSKVKLPRPGFIYTNFASYTPEHHRITGSHQLSTGTPVWSPATLYLENCVFLI
jgi:hypothetical protein